VFASLRQKFSSVASNLWYQLWVLNRGENSTNIFWPYSRRNSSKGFRSVYIRIRIFNIRYCIRIRILKSHNYDVDI
jgi:hypothetical protein